MKTAAVVFHRAAPASAHKLAITPATAQPALYHPAPASSRTLAKTPSSNSPPVSQPPAPIIATSDIRPAAIEPATMPAQADQVQDKAPATTPPAPPPSVSVVSLKYAMSLVELQLKFLANACKEERDLTEHERIVVGGIDIVGLLVAGKSPYEITNMLALHFDSKPQPQPKPQPDPKAGPAPRVQRDSLQPEGSPRSKTPEPSAQPENPWWMQTLIDRYPKEVWANVDITAGDRDGLWEALDGLDQGVLDDIRKTMEQNSSSKSQGPEGGDIQVAGRKTHDGVERSVEAEN